MMDIPMMDSYLDSVAGYVRDEDKLVTYKWLSKELEVHVNVAKLILWRYWQRRNTEKLVATFMLIGNLKSGGMRVEVVRDGDMSKAKKKFENIVSEHIYSLQKTLSDIELLAGSGKGDSRYGAIACEKSVILGEEELLIMRWGKAANLQAVSAEKKAPQTSSSEKRALPSISSKKEIPSAKETTKKPDGNNSAEAKSEEKPSKKVSPPTKQKNEKKGAIPKKPVQTTKAGFGNLFGKAGNQQKNQAASSTNGSGEASRKNSSDSSPEKNTSKAAADKLFGKSKAQENEDSSNVEKRDSEVITPEKEIESNSSTKKIESDESTKKIEKATESKKSKSKKNKKALRGTKRGRSNDSDEEIKKRKRIVIASDSSEESAAASADEDMFESPPPEPQKRIKSPSPPAIVQDGKKRKVRKLVDKTFLDEDGYLVTRKESVYESCSDEEPEIPEPKKQPEPEKSKEPPRINVRKKQTSLTSFFKKG